MRRVVSLVPSATEWLFAMGAADCVVGRSHECDWPAQATHLPLLTAPRTTATDPAHVDAQVSAAMDAVGSLYHLDRNALVALAPDVVVVQDACGVCSIDVPTVQGALAEAGLDTTLVTLRPHTIEDIFDDILTLGEAVNRHDAAQRVMVDMRARWWDTQDVVNPYVDGPRTAVIEWADPLYVAGHWTPQLIETAGGRQSIIAAGEASCIINGETLLAEQIERLIIAPCGVPLDAAITHVERLQSTSWWPLLPAVMDGSVVVVDGCATFSRPGPRLFDTQQWLTAWLQGLPDRVPDQWSSLAVAPS